MYHGFNYAADYSHLLQDNEGEKKIQRRKTNGKSFF